MRAKTIRVIMKIISAVLRRALITLRLPITTLQDSGQATIMRAHTSNLKATRQDIIIPMAATIIIRDINRDIAPQAVTITLSSAIKPDITTQPAQTSLSVTNPVTTILLAT